MHFEIVDAFTKDRFAGNPAAVIVFGAGDERFSNDSLLQSIAAEFNLSETAYNIPTEDSTAEDIKYRLRWFTPTMVRSPCVLIPAFAPADPSPSVIHLGNKSLWTCNGRIRPFTLH